MNNVAENLINSIQVHNHFQVFCRQFHLDTAYRFLHTSPYHWRNLLLLLSGRIIHRFIQPLNNTERVTALVLDDTLLERSYSQKVEKLSYHHDHNTGQSVKSHAMVNLVWTDGGTHLPLCFSLAGSPRYYTDQIVSMREEHFHPASLSYRRQEESMMTKPAIAAILLEEATKKGLHADYVLYDSWYANPSFIRLVLRKYHHHSICMLKRNKTYYEYNGHPYNLNSLYQLCIKNQSIAKAPREQLQIEQDHDVHCIGSMVVRLRPASEETKEANQQEAVSCQEDQDWYADTDKAKQTEEAYIPVKIVFVENRKASSQREWLALLSTDTNLTDEEIIRIYGKRWDIEVFHRSIKSILRVEKEFMLRDFDAIVAYVTLTCIRFCFLNWMGRNKQDQRTCGELFYQFYDELRDIQFVEALDRILQIFITFLSKQLHYPLSELNTLFTLFLSTLPRCILDSLGVIKCVT